MHSNSLEEKLYGKKVFFKDILPDEHKVKREIDSYKSDINIKKYNRKLYIDPIFSKHLPEIKSVYSVLNGKWIISNDIDDIGNHIVVLTDDISGQSIKLAFPDVVNKMRFLNELNVSHKVKQINDGINMESIVNKNVIYPEKNIKTEIKEIVNKNKSLKYGKSAILFLTGIYILKKKIAK